MNEHDALAGDLALQTVPLHDAIAKGTATPEQDRDYRRLRAAIDALKERPRAVTDRDKKAAALAAAEARIAELDHVIAAAKPQPKRGRKAKTA